MENYKNAEANNLKIYGNAFQTKCISALISDRAFLEQIFDILSPNYFENDSHKWIIDKTSEYFIKYKEMPTMEVFKMEINAIKDVVLKEAVLTEIKNAYVHVSDSDSKYIKDQFLTFCKQMKLKNAIYKSVDFLKSGNFEAIKHEVDSAMKAGMERNLGHEYLTDIEVRMSQTARSSIKTNWLIIDQLLDGGLGKGELGFIVAPSGSGKSWLLTRLGAEAMKQGKNVLHITLELNENYVGLRYDSYFSGISFQDIKHNVPVIKEKIKHIKENGGGNLYVKFFPIKSVSPSSIKMHIERLQMITGIRIDLLVVDYADLLRPFTTERGSNSYNDAGNIYEELRSVAGELQIPVWSASQTNRSGHSQDIIGAEHIADSYRKVMTGDFVMFLSRKTEDKIASTGRIGVIKNRFGKDGDTYPIEFDTSNGYSAIYEKDSLEGKAVIAKTKSAEQTIKETLKDKWNDFNNAKDNNSDDDY